MSIPFETIHRWNMELILASPVEYAWQAYMLRRQMAIEHMMSGIKPCSE